MQEEDSFHNFPLLLAVRMREQALKKDEEDEEAWMDLIDSLKELGCSPKLQNVNHWSALDEAVLAQDKKLVEYYVKWCLDFRQQNVASTLEKLANFVINYEEDFTVKLHWNVVFPLLSSFLPNDTVQFYKMGPNTRMSFTFADFKQLSIIRGEMGNIFDAAKREIKRVNFGKKYFSNPFEEVKREEIEILTGAVLNWKKLSLGAEISDFTIKPSKTLMGYEVKENIDGWETKAYDIAYKFTYTEFNKVRTQVEMSENGFGEVSFLSVSSKGQTEVEDEKKLVVEDKVVKYRLKGQVWVTDKFPLRYESFVKLLDDLPDPNKILLQVRNILKHEMVAELMENNGFPMKIKLNVMLGIAFELKFSDLK